MKAKSPDFPPELSTVLQANHNAFYQQKPFKKSHPSFGQLQSNDWQTSKTMNMSSIYSGYKKVPSRELTRESQPNGFAQTRESAEAINLYDRGSFHQPTNEVNLVLASEEEKNGLKVKKFREYSRLDLESETKSISNRSMISESSRTNVLRFSVYNPGHPKEDSRFEGAQKEVLKREPEIKFENVEVATSNYNLKERAEPVRSFGTERPVVVSRILHGAFQEGLLATIEAPEAGLKESEPGQGDDKATGGEGRERPGQRRASQNLANETVDVQLEIAGTGKFEGELIDGKMNGYGRLWDEKGRFVYEGDFIENDFEGVGVLYNHEGESISAEFEKILEEAELIEVEVFELFWEKYEGLFQKNKRHGNGYLHFGGRFILFAEFAKDEIEAGGFLLDMKTGIRVFLERQDKHLKKRFN